MKNTIRFLWRGIVNEPAGIYEQGIILAEEELILHYIPEVFKRYNIKAKSLIRVTRNADIDADALYDEDLDYRDFMAELIKRRKKLAPVRLELTREMDGEIVDVLCDYLELDSECTGTA